VKVVDWLIYHMSTIYKL